MTVTIHDLLARRHSPYALAPEPLPREMVVQLFEAARWAPSSYNEQPWAFIAAGREDEAEFGRILECLVPPNREWAKNAGLLVLTLASMEFSRNGKPNRHALHDVGLAVAQLTMQATALGLKVHQMAGIEPEKAQAEFAVPEGWEVVTGVAVGRPGGPGVVPDDIRARDERPRERKALDQIVFGGEFGKSSPMVS